MDKGLMHDQGKTGPAWTVVRDLISDRAADPAREVFETLLESGNLRIVRTVSTGQASGPYIQEEAEWVLVLQGEATLVDARGERVVLAAGDGLYLPAGCKHTVEAASDPCVWLCVYWTAEPEKVATEVKPCPGTAGAPSALPEDLPRISPLNAVQLGAFREMILSMRIVIRLPYAASLKDKRRVRQRLFAALNKENISVMEVARQDHHKELYISLTGTALTETSARSLRARIEALIHRELSDGAYLQACSEELF